MSKVDRESIERREASPGYRFVERPRHHVYAATRENLHRFFPRHTELPIQSALRHVNGILDGFYE